MRVLIAYGSKRRDLEGIARHIHDALESSGIVADVRSADEEIDLDDYDAAIVGGALHNGRWHKHSRRFVRRHAQALSARPVWLFSSGELDGTAESGNLPPVPHVRDAAIASGARDHITFGGRFSSEATGFPADAVDGSGAQDWRNVEHIRGWATGIAEQLKARRQIDA